MSRKHGHECNVHNIISESNMLLPFIMQKYWPSTMRYSYLFKFAPVSSRVIKHHMRHLSTLGRSARKSGETIRSQARAFSTNDTSFKIVERESGSLKELQPAGSNIELADLVCRLPDHRRLTFNLTWLRDSCHCDSCTHKFSRQRLFTPKDFKKDLFGVVDVQVVSRDVARGYIAFGTSEQNIDRYINIKWADGHNSFYSMNWLDKLHSLYSKARIQLDDDSWSRHLLPNDDFYAPKYDYDSRSQCWSVSDIEAGLRPVDYNDLLDGFEFHDDEPTFINANRLSDMTTRRLDSIMSLSDQLSRFGLAKIVNVPEERNQVLKVARSLAYERPTGYGTVFDVVIEPSEEINLAYSSQEFDLHSDLTYREKSPGVQMLHCIWNSVDGGLSYFCDAFQAAEILRRQNPKLFQALAQFPVVFVVRDPYRDVKFRYQRPILALDYAGELNEVYYSPFMLPPVGHRDDLKLFYLAQDELTRLLQAKENKLITKMDPGHLFIFNNRRVLHGRSSYDPKTSNRFLQGCYMDWDEITCLHEKIQSNKRH